MADDQAELASPRFEPGMEQEDAVASSRQPEPAEICASPRIQDGNYMSPQQAASKSSHPELGP